MYILFDKENETRFAKSVTLDLLSFPDDGVNFSLL